MISFLYQPALRPALPCVYGPLDYREQHTIFERIDSILTSSGLEQEFINLMLVEHEIDTQAATAKRLERFVRFSVLALRANIARSLTELDHREFCFRLADSPLLQWFLEVGEMGPARPLQEHRRPFRPLGRRGLPAGDQPQVHRPAGLR